MIRRWQKKGWFFAMHGYEHLYHEASRQKLILHFDDRSEFGSLPLEDQKIKIKKLLKIFRQNSVEPTFWVAPRHSFDQNTLKALAYEAPFKTVSGGIAISPYSYQSFNFVPQQL